NIDRHGFLSVRNVDAGGGVAAKHKPALAQRDAAAVGVPGLPVSHGATFNAISAVSATVRPSYPVRDCVSLSNPSQIGPRTSMILPKISASSPATFASFSKAAMNLSPLFRTKSSILSNDPASAGPNLSSSSVPMAASVASSER